jgi:hypothetical protein
MPMHNTLNRSEPDACAFKRFSRVETLEYSEQLIYISHIESYSIVSNEHHYLIALLVRAPYFDLGLWARAGEFDGIRNQIHECKPQHGAVSVPGGQTANLPGNVASGGLLPNLGHSFLH